MHKLLVFVVLLATCAFGQNIIPQTINADHYKYIVQPRNDIIKDLIEQIRLRMCQDMTEWGIPQLEPLQMGDIPIDLDSELAKLKGEIKNLKVVGLSTLIVEDVSFILGGFKFGLEVVIPEIEITGYLKVNGEVGGMIPINGPGGDFSIKIKGIKIDVNGKLNFGGQVFTLGILDIQLKIASLKTNIQGLVYDKEVNEFLNDAIATLGPEMIDELWADLHEILEEMIKGEADALLADLTLKDLLGILNGSSSIELPELEGEGCP